jgi:glutamate--cysteine ligase
MTDILRSDPALEEPISGREDLIRYLAGGAKPRDQWRIGTEYEKLAVDRRTGRAAPFSGPRGIEEVLRRMADRFGWTPREEDGRIVALQGPRASITLEPGGQLELSGEPCADIHCAEAELTEHVSQIVAIGEELGLAFLGLGIQPLSPVEEIEWVPKARYRIMAPYMEKVGTLGHRMMKQTATVQTNLDFSDEHDAADKIRVAMGLVPILIGMFANSSISEGRLNGYMSFRERIWADTDRSRCGLLPFVFSRDFGFEDYVDWALGVPMYFVWRDGRYLDLTGLPFGEFLRRGADGLRAKLADWQLHLTTLFPEVRLKQYIEIRCADSQPPDRMLSLPALAKGVLYDPDCRLAAWDLVKGWSWSERLDAYEASQKEALLARARGVKLLDLARELCGIAREGLSRQAVRNSRGEDETIYVRPLEAQIERGKSPAREIADRWQGEWEERVDRLIDFAAWRLP